MNYHLLIHNILFLGGGILNVALAFVVLFLRRKKIDSLVVTFVLMTLSVSTFQISQVLGAIASTGEISRNIFMFNLCVIPIQIFMTHWFFALLGNTRAHRLGLTLVYVSGFALFMFHLVVPESYLLTSVPKMYFPFYYEPGNLQWLTRAWFHIVGAYYFIVMLLAYRKTHDPVLRNRYLFVLLAVLYGFLVGETAVLLVYDINFDPMWSAFFGLYTFLIAYAVVRYQLLDIRIIIQRAFVYALSVIAMVSLISVANFSNNFVANYVPDFPQWIIPLTSSLIASGIGIFIWRKIRESDILKYEFITVIAHKFRTPLTATKWTAEEMLATETDTAKRTGLMHIRESNEKIVTLTGTLMDLANADSYALSPHTMKEISLSPIVRSVTEPFEKSFKDKHVLFSVRLPSEDVRVHADPQQMTFVLQTLLENARSYTPTGGKVIVSLVHLDSKVTLIVEDTGIGISKEDQSRIFSKFYRTHTARAADTEGFGVGLYLARSVVKRHGGKLEVHSAGEGKGSVFTVTLPSA